MTVAESEVALAPLSEHERHELAELEETIEADLRTFIEVGQSLLQIRDRRLYRDCDPPTFETYCEQRWGISRRYGYNLIDAARIGSACAQIAHIPTEAVARELVPWLSPDGDTTGVKEVWQRVIGRLDGERITAGSVRRALIAEGLAPGDDRYRVSGGRPNQIILFGGCGDRLLSASKRLIRFSERELGDKQAGKRVREEAARYAQIAHAQAEVYEAIAQGRDRPRGDDLRHLLGVKG